MGGHNKKKHKHSRKPKNNDNEIATKAVTEDVMDNASPEHFVTSRKREHYDDDDDNHEALPKKRKKKKKKPVVPAEGEKKGKKSIRQMKREKFAERQAETKANEKDQLKTQCLTYLSQWKHDKANWKFMKAKQVWLFKNKFSLNLIPNESWPILLEYFNSAQGNIRKMLLDSAKQVIQSMDEWTEKHQTPEANDSDNEEASGGKPDETGYKRARDIIQFIEE